MISGPRPLKTAQYSPTERDNGFTIVETLIFLAVSSLILVSTLTLVGGAQRKNEFNQGVRDFQQQIDDLIDNVTTGYTASQENFTCDTTSGKPEIKAASPGSGTKLGQNNNCIFIGKVLQFADQGQFDVYSVVGLRTTDGSTIVKDIVEAKPRVSALPNILVVQQKIRNNLVPKTIKRNPTGAALSAIGFFSTVNTQDEVAGNSGAQQIDLLALNDGALPSSLAVANLPGWFNNTWANSSTFDQEYLSARNPADGISICFVGPGKDQNATITIGGSDNQATSKLEYGQGAC